MVKPGSAAASRMAQGLPPVVTDPVVIARLAPIFRAALARLESAAPAPDGAGPGEAGPEGTSVPAGARRRRAAPASPTP